MKHQNDLLGLKGALSRRMAPVNTAQPAAINPKAAAAAKRKSSMQAAVAKMKAQAMRQKKAGLVK